MSHSFTNRSRPSADRISWLSLPSNHHDESSVDAHEVHNHRLSSPSIVSRPQSVGFDSGAPGPHHAASPQLPVESDRLLQADRHVTREPSMSSNEVESSLNKAPRVVAFDTSSSPFENSKVGQQGRTWSPQTLRRPFLLFLALISLILAIVLAILAWYSATHHGLRKDDGSLGLLLGWRYAPTLIAVLFTQALVMTAEDVKRTEAFARMSQPNPVEAKFTLMYVPKVWWKSVLHGFSQRKNGGHKRWMLAFSSLAAGLSILVISTFASSVLLAKDVAYHETVQLQRYTPERNSTIALQPQRDTYYHTITSYLYNASTSIWVDDSHVILPFGHLGQASSESLQDGLWEADTIIFQLESECESLSMSEKIVLEANYSYADTSLSNRTFAVNSKGFRLRSADGCEVQLQTPIALQDVRPGSLGSQTSPDGFQTDAVPQNGGIIWTNMSSTYVSWQDIIRKRGPVPLIDRNEELILKKTFIYDLSDQCRGRDLLIVSPPWWTSSFPLNVPEDETQKKWWDNFTVKAEVCTPTIYSANLPVQQTVTNGIAQVRFDRKEFTKRRQPVSKGFFDLDRLNDLAFNEAWSKFLTVEAGVEENEGYEGVSMLLGKHYSLDLTAMLLNKTFDLEASRLRSRFFGELVLSSVTMANTPAQENVDGKVNLTDRKIMVVTEIAITLIVLFILAFCYCMFMLWGVSAGRRHLHLYADPATVAGSASVLRLQSGLASVLQLFSGKQRKEVRQGLDRRIYTIPDGMVAEVTAERAKTSSTIAPAKKSKSWRKRYSTMKTDRKDWRPSMLHKRWLVTLLAALAALAITLLVLRSYAREQRLYRTAFVYQIDFGLFNTSFSPHSVIAALVAVAISLSWDGVDKSMRTLQPYLSMTRGTSAADRGVLLSYQSSYWIVAAVKAALRRHWILSLVTIGTTLAQILVISMAAIFERQSVLRAQPTADLDGNMYSYAFRQDPFNFHIGLPTRPFYLHESLLQTTQADWLYTALDEITLSNTPPVWTKDEWVYTPVSITRLPNTTTIVQDTGTNDISSATSGLGASPANVTVTTSALRSRLKCSNVPVPATGWLDRAEDIFEDRTQNRISGWILPSMLFQNETYKSPVFTVPRRMACCTNGTASGSQSAIAFWSSSNPMTEERPAVPIDPNGLEDLREPSIWTSNFTIKWIVGPTSSTLISGADPRQNIVQMGVGLANETLLYFTEEPRMAMMSCTPVIEHANASVTIARSTSQVLQAKIIAEPQPAPGAWGYPFDIEYDHPAIDEAPKNLSSGGTTFSSQESRGNVSWGHFFMSTLLTAPHIIDPPNPSSWLVFNKSIEDLSSERFSIRDPSKGLNMDFMSYATYHLVNSDPTALLNNTALLQHSEKTFQTFFKHFAATGKWTYGGSQIVKSSVYDNDYGPGTAQEVNGTFTERIEVLAMNETATWLSVVVIFLLIVILVVLIISLQIVYPKDSMQHHVECLADVLLMVAGSDEFIELVHERGVLGIKDSDVRTKLGWFRDRRGVVRWGIEVVDGDVEWVDAPETEAKCNGDREDIWRRLRSIAGR